LETQKVLLEKLGKADIAMILGSGLQKISDGFSDLKKISFSEIPLMPKSTVSGHKGEVLYGNSNGKTIVIWCGRIHRYEGYKTYELNIIALLSALLGCKYLIATNASGGGQADMEAGCIMLINSFLNRVGVCPLKYLINEGLSDDSVFDTDSVLKEEDMELVRTCARTKGIKLYEGPYNWAPGPNYESHLETKIGIDHKIGAFGMSTVYELMTAKKLGLRLIAISMVSNKASVLCKEELTHKEVLEKMDLCVPKVKELLTELLSKIQVPKDEISVFNAKPKFENLLITCPKLCRMPSLQEAKNALAEVIMKVNKGIPLVSFAINAMINKMDCSSMFTIYEEIAYSSLPYVPTFSQAANELQIGVGILKTGECCLVLHNASLVSTYPIESKAIAEILKSTKCSFVLHVVRAYSSKFDKEGIILVRDTMNLCSYDSLEYKHISFNPELRKSINNILLKDLPEKNEFNLAGIEGPAIPSKPERYIIENSGLQWFSLSNLSLIDSIRSERIPFGIIGVCNSLNGKCTLDESALKSYIYEVFPTKSFKDIVNEMEKSIIKGSNLEARLKLNSSDEIISNKTVAIKLDVFR